MSRTLGILGIFLVIYACSAGPVAWLGNRLHWSEAHGIGRCVIIVLYPHVMVLDRSPAYRRYLRSWQQ
jgi:hypothetical protein